LGRLTYSLGFRVYGEKFTASILSAYSLTRTRSCLAMSTELTEVTAISMQRRACKVFHQRKNIVRTITPPPKENTEVAILSDTRDYIFMSSRSETVTLRVHAEVGHKQKFRVARSSSHRWAGMKAVRW
jgi:hypothetical protein